MGETKTFVNVINVGINPLPTFTKKGDACVDLRADFTHGINAELGVKWDFNPEENCIILHPGGRYLVPTCLYTSFSDQYMLKILQRSGLALKSGVICLGGVIDSGYRSQIGVILVNLSDQPFKINQGDRIAQAALIPIERFTWNEVEELDESDRGATGFGNSGVK